MRAPLMLRRNRYERVSTENSAKDGIAVIAPTIPRDLLRPLPTPVEPQAIGDAGGGIRGGPLTSLLDGVLRLARAGDSRDYSCLRSPRSVLVRGGTGRRLSAHLGRHPMSRERLVQRGVTTF